MLHSDLETEDGIVPEETASTTKDYIHVTPLDIAEEETPASD